MRSSLLYAAYDEAVDPTMKFLSSSGALHMILTRAVFDFPLPLVSLPLFSTNAPYQPRFHFTHPDSSA